MKVTVYNQSAQPVGDVELNARIFEIKPNMHLLAEAVRVQQSNARKGLAHTKTRADVSGGGKKPWKQKGTGRARVGSTRSPIWRHGGITFGPRSNRNWELKINKKAKTKALFMSLSDKAKDGRLIVIDSIKLDPVKTKEFIKIMAAFDKVSKFGKRQLFLMPKKSDELVRASRNIQSVTSALASSLNVVDVLNADHIVLLKDALAIIERTYLKEAKPKVKAKAPAAAKASATKVK
jgi:large subunit ribosomal protein L4